MLPSENFTSIAFFDDFGNFGYFGNSGDFGDFFFSGDFGDFFFSGDFFFIFLMLPSANCKYVPSANCRIDGPNFAVAGTYGCGDGWHSTLV